ncbi:hypothetical protein L1987_59028 [Smallanthus sonchifolius]|uniref:Uncharacterized protein n=1 Tax=Smallanthus sonchifolius TaxID=185202 RepID=A0ACB9D4P6_9ASTR|nr:hypothetical protein L1987_59028 [Smallanthus sonchifolius]
MKKALPKKDRKNVANSKHRSSALEGFVLGGRVLTERISRIGSDGVTVVRVQNGLLCGARWSAMVRLPTTNS